nr:hypothetical protein [Tolivirales sp.]
MSQRPTKAGAPAKAAPLTTARPVDGTRRQGLAAPSKGQTTNLNQSVAVARSKAQRGDVHQKDKAGKHIAQNVRKEVEVFKSTALYLRGRDSIYPDAASLARFNAWITANQDRIDPAEQRVCVKCGHVDFTLCAHSIKEDTVAPAPAAVVIVPQNLRHHEWSFRPVKALTEAFQWPGFDTHSQSDARLHGFSNHHLPDDLIIPELFSYLTFNMQTSYLVNGVDDRALRLSHVHRLAQKWVISKNLESEVEADQHYCVRIKFTVQRACDNAQNAMLYGQRDPARNFGLAWLPGSRVSQLMLCLLVVIALLNFTTTLGLAMRTLEVVSYAGSAALYILKCVAVSVPDLVPRIYVSASQHRSGNELSFQCVSTDYDNRWYVPEGDAHAVIQSCNFMDWVMAGVTEAYYQSSETSERTWSHITKSRDDFCGRTWLELAGYRIIWAGKQLEEALNLGQIGPLDVLRLWAWTLWAEIRLLMFRC